MTIMNTAKLWTRNCHGCKDASFHTAHLTWVGRFYFRHLAGATNTHDAKQGE